MQGQEKQEVAELEGQDLYLETEQNANYFDNKMHPTKIAEKNWEHSYKLAQLIQQQEKMIEKDTWMVEQFGGITNECLRSAFTMGLGRCKSSAGYRSPD